MLTGYGKSLDNQSNYNKLASPARSPYKDYDDPSSRQKITLPRVTAHSQYKEYDKLNTTETYTPSKKMMHITSNDSLMSAS